MERELEIVGEAARGVSEPFRFAHTEIPWRKIVAHRHVLAHEYGAIRLDDLWRVATVHAKDLVASLTPLIPPPPLADNAG
ncbi:MAG: DUF86 domain-containing protein [Phycisphaerales bacterium]|nr:DUF86 domain-containing protein [Phycisphaerales bacterium]